MLGEDGRAAAAEHPRVLRQRADERDAGQAGRQSAAAARPGSLPARRSGPRSAGPARHRRSGPACPRAARDSGAPASAPTRAASLSTRRTCSSMTSIGTAPSRTAATSLAPHGLPRAGMAISRPPFAAPTVSRAASQSDTIAPSNCHSPFSTPTLQRGVLGHRDAVDAVVGGHHAPGAGLADDRLEGREVKLAQSALAHLGAGREPLGLVVVGDEMLDGSGHALILDARHVAGPDLAGEQRILGVGLEMAAAERAAVQVDRRREQHVHALAPRLLAEQPARRSGPGPDPRSRPVPSGSAARSTDRWRSTVVPRTPTGPSDMTMEARPIAGTAGSVQVSWPDRIRTFVSRSRRSSAASTAASCAASTAASCATFTADMRASLSLRPTIGGIPTDPPSRSAGRDASGSVSWTIAPPSGRLPAVTVPPCARAMACDDGQAEAGPAIGASPAAVRPPEPLESVRQVVGREAGPGVGHRDRQSGPVAAAEISIGLPGRREPQRVVDEVVDGLPDPAGIDQRDQSGRHADQAADARRPRCAGGCLLGAAGEQRGQVGGLGPDGQLVLVAARQQQQVVGDPGQPGRLLGGGGDGLGQLFAAAAGLGGQLQLARAAPRTGVRSS